jgi:hypothetical protein
VIVLGIDKTKFPKEYSDSLRAINNLIRPTSRGFATKLLKSYEKSAVGPSRLRVERHRIEIAQHGIARGLFYHHRGIQLPPTVPFEFRDVSNPSIPTFGRDWIGRLESDLFTIGQGQFRYSCAFEPLPDRDQFDTFWLMRFYDHRTFFCATGSN